jgi:hypothetical protein
MDFHEARNRREASVPEPAATRRATTRKRAEDARLRRAIREAFARQRRAAADEQAPPRLHVVADDAP